MGAVIFALPQFAPGDSIITIGDPVIAIDEDRTSNSNYPGAEGPSSVVDQSAETKYLNFAKENSGFIVTPAGGDKALRSFIFTTANDSEERDPASVIIYGTNEAIVSADNTAGDAETWTQITAIDLALPSDRLTQAAVVNIANDSAYSSYKFIFPTMKGAGHNSMQIADLQGWDDIDALGAPLFGATDSVLAVHEASPESAYPAAEGPGNLFDGDTNTKYLNFGRENSGFIVTPSIGATLVNSFLLTSANDAEGRDPILWDLYGTNDTIVTEDNGDGFAENWTLIASGEVETPFDRFTAAPEVFFANSNTYTSYKFLVRSIREPDVGGLIDSTQFSEFQLCADASGGRIHISNIDVNLVSGEATIEWLAPSNGTYDLQFSPDLLDWSGIVTSGLKVEDGSSYTFPMPASDSGSVFFRITPTPAF
ncbi:MAG: hypothetical protein ACSHYF_10850 [Verrucomicrobiaceae bacterium]